MSKFGQGCVPGDISKLKSLMDEQTKALLTNVPTDPTIHIDTDRLSDEQRQKFLAGMAYAATHPEIDTMMQDQI